MLFLEVRGEILGLGCMFFSLYCECHPEVKLDMRDGSPLFLRRCPFLSFKNPQQVPKDPSVVDQIKAKINKVGCCSSIASVQFLSLMSYFHMPKGDLYIRIVYDLIYPFG